MSCVEVLCVMMGVRCRVWRWVLNVRAGHNKLGWRQRDVLLCFLGCNRTSGIGSQL